MSGDTPDVAGLNESAERVLMSRSHSNAVVWLPSAVTMVISREGLYGAAVHFETLAAVCRDLRVNGVDDFDPEAAARAVTEALRPLGTPERAAREKQYLKSDLEFLGVAVPDIRRTVKAAVRDYPGLGVPGMVAWAVALWREPVHERRAAAVEILTLAAPRLAAGDLITVERLLRESWTWAYVDGLAGNVAGEIALRDPAGAWPRIDAWAADADFWVRRSSLLALLRGIRAGTPDLRRFARYAEPMLTERQFFIRKAVGWVLREISRRDPAWAADWTEAHLSEMSGVTFGEAVRRLAPQEADRLRQLRSVAGERVRGIRG